MKLSQTNSLMGGSAGLAAPYQPYPETATERVCPECGAAMAEFDRLVEDGAMFIWYACTREACMGQWLTKKALRMRGD